MAVTWVMNRHILLLCGLLLAGNASAVELFGVDLSAGSREELRAAVKKNGAILISEDGDDQWFDAYDSSELMPGSRRLYLGFVRSSGAFSFVEYEFPGIKTEAWRARLEARYGKVDEITKGRFLSDHRYIWRRDGLSIELYSDWANYRVVLSYRNETNLQQLLTERSQAQGIMDDVTVY